MPIRETKIQEWRAAGLLSESQMHAILEYERGNAGRPWIFSGILILGAATIGIGLVSLVASRWESIPDGVKLGFDGFILAMTVMSLLWIRRSRSAALYEGVLLFFLVSILASIGLIAQIFHTGGEFEEAVLFWAVITAGAAATSRGKMIPTLWAVGFFGSGVWVLARAFHPPYAMEVVLSPVLALVPLVCALILLLLRTRWPKHLLFAFRCVFVTGWVAAIFTFDALRSTDAQTRVPWPLFLSVDILGLACLVLLSRCGPFTALARKWGIAGLGLFLVAAQFCAFHLNASFLYALTTVFLFGITALFFATVTRRRLFEGFLFLVGGRLLFVYFEVFGGLATTGIGLIFSGALIMAATLVWNRYRTDLGQRAENWGSR